MAQQADDLPEPITRPEDDWVLALLDYADELATASGVDPATVGADLATMGDDGWPDLAPIEARAWRPTDDGSAEWAMGHVLDADQQLAVLDAQAQAWADEARERLARIQAWFDHRAKPLLSKRAFFATHLEHYALRLRDEDPKAKTVVLPSGVVKTTEQQPKAAVADDAQVAAWVTCWYPELVSVVCPPVAPKVYVQPLRQATHVVEVIDHARLVLANTGEVIEWATREYVASGRGQLSSAVQLGDVCPQQGDGWPTPDDATDLVAMVQVLASHPEVHDPDGRQVPGTTVEPGGVTAKVVPAP